jgi:hypothetical protein
VTNILPPEVSAAIRDKLAPGYETDPNAVGVNREAVDPDGDKHWTEVHGLSEEEAAGLLLVEDQQSRETTFDQ